MEKRLSRQRDKGRDGTRRSCVIVSHQVTRLKNTPRGAPDGQRRKITRNEKEERNSGKRERIRGIHTILDTSTVLPFNRFLTPLRSLLQRHQLRLLYLYVLVIFPLRGVFKIVISFSIVNSVNINIFTYYISTSCFFQFPAPEVN